MANQVKIYTGYKSYFLYICKKNGKFAIDSGDKPFIEYYTEIDTRYDTYKQAYTALIGIKKKYNLERFDR